MTKPIKLPNPDHPIGIEPNPLRVIVRAGGEIIADTRSALTLREADYPPVQYVPRSDVNKQVLERSAHKSYCPYKGDCSYFSIAIGGPKSVNAAWSYERPYVAVARIREYIAFDPDHVDSISELPWP